MKKVLFVTSSLCVGGMERMQVTLANMLSNMGYDVTIITLNPNQDLAYELNDDVRILYKPDKQFPVLRKIKYIWTFYDEGVWETRASAKTLYKYYVGNEKYDVEIAFFRGLPIKIISGSTNKDAVHLAWVHSDFRQAQGFLNNFKSLKSVRDAYASYKNVICVSRQAMEGFKEVIGDTHNLITIYNTVLACDIKKKADKIPEKSVRKKSFHIVLIGRLLDSAKGQKRLITAVSKLHNKGYDISLALVGGGRDEKMLKEEIKNCKADDYITMTGNQLNPYPYIKEADLLVCASYFEGYNLTVAEALILGVPVLSTNCTGPNEILDSGKYGLIVENSEEGLYSGIKRLIENPNLLNYYREKADERRSFFDEEKIAKQITDLF